MPVPCLAYSCHPAAMPGSGKAPSICPTAGGTSRRTRAWRGLQRVQPTGNAGRDRQESDADVLSLPGLGKTETVLEVWSRNLNLSRRLLLTTEARIQSAPTCGCTGMARTFLDDCDILARSEPCAEHRQNGMGTATPCGGAQPAESRRNDDAVSTTTIGANPNIHPPRSMLDRRHGVIWNSNENLADSGSGLPRSWRLTSPPGGEPSSDPLWSYRRTTVGVRSHRLDDA